MNQAAENVADLQVALSHAARLLDSEPALAAEQADEILRVAPGHPTAHADRWRALAAPTAMLAGALELIGALVLAQPAWPAAHFEHAVALGAAGRGEAAVAALRRAVQIQPDLGGAWRLLGDHLAAMGDTGGADAAYAAHVRASTRDPRLLAPAAALCEGRIAVAERLLREHLKAFPTDVAAIRMFAEVAARLGRFADAENLLARCLDLAPSFTAARHNYAVVLHRQGKSAAALREVERLLAGEPGNPGYRGLQAAVLARLGEFDRAIAVYEDLLAGYPGQARLWMSYGHAVKTAGRQPRSIEAYRRSIELEPSLGEAYWSLANLKTYRFAPGEVAAMRDQLARTELGDEDRLHFHFALGKALEDAGETAESFEHYAAGNRLRHGAIGYDANDTTAPVERSKRAIFPGFLRAARRFGQPVARPDLHRRPAALGLDAGRADPRRATPPWRARWSCPTCSPWCGSSVAARGARSTPGYPDVLAGLDPGRLRALGERYLAGTRVQRKTRAVLHRQAAEQLGPRRPDPPDAAERPHRRRAPTPDELLASPPSSSTSRVASTSATTSRTSAATTATTSP
jgi:tetratricopeptide (TPR) repeat protein